MADPKENHNAIKVEATATKIETMEANAHQNKEKSEANVVISMMDSNIIDSRHHKNLSSGDEYTRKTANFGKTLSPPEQ